MRKVKISTYKLNYVSSILKNIKYVVVLLCQKALKKAK